MGGSGTSASNTPLLSNPTSGAGGVFSEIVGGLFESLVLFDGLNVPKRDIVLLLSSVRFCAGEVWRCFFRPIGAVVNLLELLLMSVKAASLRLLA